MGVSVSVSVGVGVGMGKGVAVGTEIAAVGVASGEVGVAVVARQPSPGRSSIMARRVADFLALKHRTIVAKAYPPEAGPSSVDQSELWAVSGPPL